MGDTDDKVRACSDPDDDIFLECAQAASAHYLVTGNGKHFPATGAVRGSYRSPVPWTKAFSATEGFELRARRLVGQGDAFGEGRPGLPAQLVHAAYVEQLLRGSVGLCGVEDQLAFETQDGADLLG